MIIKAGGSFLEEKKNIALLSEELRTLRSHFLLVHGGGKSINQLTEKFGYSTKFHQGVRITSAKEMPLVDMVLAGELNTCLVRALRKEGIQAIGLTGADGIVVGQRMFANSHTGRADTCNTDLIQLLWQHSYTPVLASVASDDTYQGLNINADSLAEICAYSLKAEKLIFLSDVAGVYHHKKIIPRIKVEDIESLIKNKIVQSGMIAKLRSVRDTILKGGCTVHIGTLKKSGDLSLLAKGEIGSHVC